MQYIGGIWDEYKSAVAASRKLSVEELDALADRYMGLQTAEDNLAAGLVDTIVYCQDMDSLLRVYAGTKDYHLLKTAKLANVKRVESKAKDKVAVLYLEGQIYDDGNEGIVGKNVIKTIKKIQKDDQVKALVLRGCAYPSGAICIPVRLSGAEAALYPLFNTRSKLYTGLSVPA